MHNLKLFPYQIASESARDLAHLLNIKRLRYDSDSFVPKYGQCIVNWGNSQFPDWWSKAQLRQVKMLNAPSAVNLAANKLLTFQTLKAAGVRIPEFTTNFYLAERWFMEGATVFERHELRGRSGEGIRIVNSHDPEMAKTVSFAPLYTKFVPKTAEFRVHVFRGKVIDYIEKKKVAVENRPENFSPYISSTEQGWVFARQDIRVMPEVKEAAIKAITALGLDFGAVDVAYADGLPFILEVNTAPGLGGTTLVNYANALRQYMGAADLPLSVTSSIIDEAVQTARPTAAPVAQVSTALADSELVTLTIDRATARKLRSLLSAVC